MARTVKFRNLEAPASFRLGLSFGMSFHGFSNFLRQPGSTRISSVLPFDPLQRRPKSRSHTKPGNHPCHRRHTASAASLLRPTCGKGLSALSSQSSHGINVSFGILLDASPFWEGALPAFCVWVIPPPSPIPHKQRTVCSTVARGSRTFARRDAGKAQPLGTVLLKTTLQSPARQPTLRSASASPALGLVTRSCQVAT